MIFPMIVLHPYTFAILTSVTFLIILFVTFLCVYHRWRSQRTSRTVNDDKYLLYPIGASITSNLSMKEIQPKQPSKFIREPLPHLPMNELAANYKTFDLAQRHRKRLSSDSSHTSSSARRSPTQNYSFGTVKSKFQQIHVQESVTSEQKSVASLDSEELDTESLVSTDSGELSTEALASASPSFEYSLVELFQIELVYKLSYSSDEHQLLLQIVRLTAMQPLIEQCFPSLLCKIHLVTTNHKHQSRKLISRKDPINELFKFDLEPLSLINSYLKVHAYGYQKNDKRLELGQTVLVMNQHNPQSNLPTSNQFIKSIQIYEDRIDMIIREQAKNENEARALVCLVYENDRCLLHVGLIKILGIQYLLKQRTSHSHHRDQIQVKICTVMDGKILSKRKSKLFPLINGTCTYSTSFHLDYISLHKTSVRIIVSYRRSLITTHGKPISMIEFGSTQLKTQQSFQHWTDTLAIPNRPHVHWHILEEIHSGVKLHS